MINKEEKPKLEHKNFDASKVWMQCSETQAERLAEQWKWKGNRYIRDLFIKCVKKYALDNTAPNGKHSCLDLACGSGELAIPLYDLGLNVTGIDVNQAFLNIMIKNKNNRQITIIHDDIFHTTALKRYNFIVARFLFNHYKNTYDLLDICAKHLKPRGIVIFNHNNRDSVTLGSHILGKPYSEMYKACFASRSSIARDELIAWCFQNNFRILEQIPYLFFAYSPIFKILEGYEYAMPEDELASNCIDEQMCSSLPLNMHGQLITIAQRIK